MQKLSCEISAPYSKQRSCSLNLWKSGLECQLRSDWLNWSTQYWQYSQLLAHFLNNFRNKRGKNYPNLITCNMMNSATNWNIFWSLPFPQSQWVLWYVPDKTVTSYYLQRSHISVKYYFSIAVTWDWKSVPELHF